MSASRNEFNERIIEEFRANSGRVGEPFKGIPLLLLHHKGAKTGASRINPLAYLGDDGRYVIFASKGGAPSNPDWYHNVKANPDVQIEVGTDTFDAVASEATSEERDRLYDEQKGLVPSFADYEQKTERLIPVIVLTPAAA